ncbi:MAG: 30S ribosomal protein S10 [Candidatus Staskawiczbacteria bacterium]|nr:30S ribosomal protein S10 [Candidatus Staskawiczbacteria bacterium]
MPAKKTTTRKKSVKFQDVQATEKETKTAEKEKRITEEQAKPKIRIKLKAYDHKIIDNSARSIIDIANRYGAEVSGPVPLPTEILKFTVNRSSFIHKNAREQFEMRVHKRIIDILNPNAEIIEALRDLNLPSGVDISIKI